MYWFSTTDIRKWRAIHRGGAEGIWEDADGRGREEEAAGGLKQPRPARTCGE